MASSGFSSPQDHRLSFADSELLTVSGGTCVCLRVRRHGKWHFVKQLRPELAGDPRYVEAMRKEFETGYRLDHPALARYVELGDDYIMMEYVDGQPLDEFADTHPDVMADRAAARRLVEQLLDAVRYLHHHQVLHLDLKPANILVTRIGHDLRLIDFGFCYTDAWRDTTGLTAVWAAPEQLAGGPVDERTDIYALGRILQSLPLPKAYVRLTRRCTTADPGQRFQSVDQILAALPHRHRWPIVAEAAAVVLAIAGWLQRDRLIPQQAATITDTADTALTIPADTLAPPTIEPDTHATTVPAQRTIQADTSPAPIEEPTPTEERPSSAASTPSADGSQATATTAPPRHIQSIERSVQDNIDELYLQARSSQRTPRIIFLRQALPQQLDELIEHYSSVGNYEKVSEYTYKRQVVMQVFNEMGL